MRQGAGASEAAADTCSAGAAPVRGDLDDRPPCWRACGGCDRLPRSRRQRDVLARPRAQDARERRGLGDVVRAASAAKVARVVHTSSAAAIGEASGVIGREDTPHRGSFLSQYERSKLLAERKVLALGTELGVPVVCVNPSSVQSGGLHSAGPPDCSWTS